MSWAGDPGMGHTRAVSRGALLPFLDRSDSESSGPEEDEEAIIRSIMMTTTAQVVSTKEASFFFFFFKFFLYSVPTGHGHRRQRRMLCPRLRPGGEDSVARRAPGL